jgi:hypothetical protein
MAEPIKLNVFLNLLKFQNGKMSFIFQMKSKQIPLVFNPFFVVN